MAARRRRSMRSPAIAKVVDMQRAEARLQAEQLLDRNAALEDSLNRHRAMFEQMPIPMAVLSSHGVILELNLAAVTILSRVDSPAVRDPAAAFRGKPMLTLVDRLDFKRFLDHLLKSARGTSTIDLMMNRRGGGTRAVRLISERRTVPGVANDTLYTVIVDLTNDRRIDAELRASEERYREIVEASNEGICIVDDENHVVFANRRLGIMLGANDGLVGRSALEFIPVEDRERASVAFERREIGNLGQTEQRLQRADGSVFWTSVSTGLMHDKNDRFVGMLRMFTDMTARQEIFESREALVRQLVAAQEGERQRIARELHDQMGQHIVALSLGLARLATTAGMAEQPEAAALMDQLRRTADLLGRDVHTLALELRPSTLDHLGLGAALSSYAADVAARTGLEIDVHCDGVDHRHLSAAAQTGIYRIAQEALTNAVKHASAHRVSIILEPHSDAVQLIVEDDGHGFDVWNTRRARNKLGLAGMDERAALLGGTLTIESTPGRGTAVYARIPMGAVEGHDNEPKTTTVAR